jgi:hypothetical protein
MLQMKVVSGLSAISLCCSGVVSLLLPYVGSVGHVASAAEAVKQNNLSRNKRTQDLNRKRGNESNAPLKQPSQGKVVSPINICATSKIPSGYVIIRIFRTDDCSEQGFGGRPGKAYSIRRPRVRGFTNICAISKIPRGYVITRTFNTDSCSEQGFGGRPGRAYTIQRAKSSNTSTTRDT